MVTFQRLSEEMIDSQPEIQKWLSQFDTVSSSLARQLLLQLRFVSHDSFAAWLSTELAALPGSVAVFSVRKPPKKKIQQSELDEKQITLWNGNQFIERPAGSMGSEDLVASLVSQWKKKTKGHDYPDIKTMRSQRVRRLIFIDDGIGSGDRMSKFVKAFFDHPTIKSWWSLGLLSVTILSFSRVVDAEAVVLNAFPGRGTPKARLLDQGRVKFQSVVAFHKGDVKVRWGSQGQELIDFCRNEKRVGRPEGYGETMTNLVFYHSVPNNLPGVLWADKKNFRGLFPRRSLPTWIPDIFTKTPMRTPFNPGMEEMVGVLSQVKRGLRHRTAIARQLDADPARVGRVLEHLYTVGCVTEKGRLSDAGRGFLNDNQKKLAHANFVLLKEDYWNYVPTKWRSGAFLDRRKSRFGKFG